MGSWKPCHFGTFFPPQFSQEVESGFQIPNFQISAEHFETTWVITNKFGRVFKLSNGDLITALSEIVQNWDVWEDRKLNINDVNPPDDTLKTFAKEFFFRRSAQRRCEWPKKRLSAFDFCCCSHIAIWDSIRPRCLTSNTTQRRLSTCNRMHGEICEEQHWQN